MIQIINSSDEIVMEITSKIDKKVSTILLANLENQRFLAKFDTMKSAQIKSAVAISTKVDIEKVSKLSDPENQNLSDMSSKELESIVELSESIELSKQEKIDLAFDLLKILKLEDVELSFLELFKLFDLVMIDGANQIPR
jgi:hypothetical protein